MDRERLLLRGIMCHVSTPSYADTHYRACGISILRVSKPAISYLILRSTPTIISYASWILSPQVASVLDPTSKICLRAENTRASRAVSAQSLKTIASVKTAASERNLEGSTISKLPTLQISFATIAQAQAAVFAENPGRREPSASLSLPTLASVLAGSPELQDDREYPVSCFRTQSRGIAGPPPLPAP